ncbi:MAG TPA: molybdopterin-dependent oxidoreductase, partial [Arenibaculum sp.]|nr:molybdopterin-dependent oxidoreductase [Arenibaculum sp.]
RRTRTAAQADWHLPVPAGADAALALSVMHVLVRDGRCDRAWLERHAHGFDRLEADVLPRFAPDAVAASTGIAPGDVERLAGMLADARAPFIRIGCGPSRNRRGGAAIRTVALLPALVGAYGRPGAGACLSMDTASSLALTALQPSAPRPAPRVVNHARLGRALLELSDPPVKALFVAANNPAVTCPDSQRVRRGLSREDLFTVVHAPFVNDTALHADIVLPAATFLETEDVYAAYGTGYVQYAPAAIPPVGQSRSNADLARDLARCLGVEDELFALDQRALVERTVRGTAIDGPDLWAGRPVKAGRPQPGPAFATPTGRIEFHSTMLAETGGPALPDWTPDPPGDPALPLRLLTAPGHFLSHTAFSGVAFLRTRQGEPAILLHPRDADRRGLRTGEPVEAFNALGRIVHRLRVSDEVPPGTALIVGQRPAADAHAGTVNDLCSDALSDIGEGATYQDTRIEVRAMADRCAPETKPRLCVEADR